eukprot:353516-Chlamydomonas_euryale.AAC.3
MQDCHDASRWGMVATHAAMWGMQGCYACGEVVHAWWPCVRRGGTCRVVMHASRWGMVAAHAAMWVMQGRRVCGKRCAAARGMPKARWRVQPGHMLCHPRCSKGAVWGAGPVRCLLNDCMPAGCFFCRRRAVWGAGPLGCRVGFGVQSWPHGHEH